MTHYMEPHTSEWLEALEAGDPVAVWALALVSTISGFWRSGPRNDQQSVSDEFEFIIIHSPIDALSTR